jgi:hypothetical protein
MKKHNLMLAIAGSCTLIVAVAMAAPANATHRYRWHDKDGVVTLGDTVPPEYADDGYDEINEQGVVVRRVPRRLTAAEAASAQLTAEETARRRQRDAFLLKSYTRVSEIEQQRDERIALIDSQMNQTRSSIEDVDRRIAAQQDRLSAFRPYSASADAGRVPDQLAQAVVRALSERRTRTASLQQHAKEKAEQLAAFNADIARYRELTAGSSQP